MTNKLLEQYIEKSKDIIVGPKASNNANLIYFADLGFGYLEKNVADSDVYDEEYFERYRSMARTEIGQKLNTARIVFTISEFNSTDDTVVDIGVGGANFVEEMREQGYNCTGDDVNKFAAKHLAAMNAYTNLKAVDEKPNFLTFWDVLEHLDDPTFHLQQPTTGVFISMPIYKGFDDILKSKHYKPNEHIWYFTSKGLENFMNDQGFSLVKTTDVETLIGRESILSFYFEKT